MSSTIRFFICGSALRGQPDHGVLGGVRFLEEVRTAPRYRMHSVNDAHPAVYPGGTRRRVSLRGELYELTAAQHEALLSQEPPGLYEGDIILQDGSKARAMLFPGPLLKNVAMSTSLLTAAGPPACQVQRLRESPSA